MRKTRGDRFRWDAGLWVPAKPAIIRPRARNFLPGFCIAGVGGDAPNPDAFGTLMDFATSGQGSPTPATMSTSPAAPVPVYVGDLVYVACCLNSGSLSQGAASDNLGNTYTAANAGTDSGANATGRAYYSRITIPGDLDTVDVVHTGGGDGSNGYRVGMAIFAGPFKVSPVDKNPANNTDSSSPHNAPSAAGPLAQAIEVVVSWIAWDNGGGTTIDTITVGTQIFRQHSAGGTAGLAMCYTVTAATSAVNHAWTSGSNPGAGAVMGTTSFMNGT